MDAYELFDRMQELRETGDRLGLFNMNGHGVMFITIEDDYFLLETPSVGIAIAADHVVPINGNELELQDAHRERIGHIDPEIWKVLGE